MAEHRSWGDGTDPKPKEAGMKDANPENWRRWVVKLQFLNGAGLLSWGSGFFVNFDTSKCSIVLTAAHNLISDTGQPLKDLTILRDPASENIKVHSSQIKICQKYKDNPGPQNRVNDYGVLILDHDPGQGGFGFSLDLGLTESIGKEAYVTSHYRETATGYPITNSGTIERVKPDYLRYKIKTIPGNSGGPVWAPYGGYETAIAIHNYGADPKDSNPVSQGTRLNHDVLRDILQWAEMGWSSKSLKVAQKTSPSLGLYLRLSTEFSLGRVRLGPEELETVFDVVPGLTPSGKIDSDLARYVFRFHPPIKNTDDSEDYDSDDNGIRPGQTKKKDSESLLWVRWRAEQNRVELSEEFRDDCLVRLVPKAKAYEIHRNEHKLRMRDDMIPKPPSTGRDGFYSFYESSEISFIPREGKSTKFPYCLFSLV